MPVINPSKSFQGSEMGNNDAGSVVKPGVRRIAFSDPKYKEGVYLFILPPYKQDSMGNGVWYRVVNVRDNFGVDVKERLVETDDSPINYFSKQVKIKFPSYAEIQKIEKNGMDMKIYPSYGRISRRVLFNTAFANDLGKGAHVIEVPNWGCADQIDKYHRKPTVTGQPVELICNYKVAVPVFFKLSKDVKGQPWSVMVDPSKTYELPEGLADSDNLYNLDDVLVIPDNDVLLHKLRQVTPANIFDSCMEGYAHMGHAVSMSTGHPAMEVKSPITPTVQAPAPVQHVEIPKAVISIPSAVISPAAQNLRIPSAGITPMDNRVVTEVTSAETNPMGGISAEEAKKWLKKKA